VLSSEKVKKKGPACTGAVGTGPVRVSPHTANNAIACTARVDKHPRRQIQLEIESYA